MKLVDILARELKSWPFGGHFAWQDYDKEVRFSPDSKHDFHMSELAEDNVRPCHGLNPLSGVTRAEWQAAVDALKAEKAEEINWPNGATHYEPSRGAGKNPVFYHVLDGKALYAWAVLSSGEHMDCPTNNPYGWDFDSSTAIPRPIESYADQINATKIVEWDGEDTPAVGVICEFHESTSGWNSAVVKYSSDHCVVLERDNGYEVCIFTIFPSRSVRPIRTAEQVAAEERKSEILEMIDTFGTDTAIWGRDAVMEICGHLWESGYRKEPKPCGS